MINHVVHSRALKTAPDGTQTIEAYPSRPGRAGEFEGDAYVAALGRPEEAPSNLGDLVLAAKRANSKIAYRAHFDDDGQYTGYSVSITHAGKQRSFMVTGAASRFVPLLELEAMGAKGIADAHNIREAARRDAPARSGNFAGGMVMSAVQGRRRAATNNQQQEAQVMVPAGYQGEKR